MVAGGDRRAPVDPEETFARAVVCESIPCTHPTLNVLIQANVKPPPARPLADLGKAQRRRCIPRPEDIYIKLKKSWSRKLLQVCGKGRTVGLKISVLRRWFD